MGGGVSQKILINFEKICQKKVTIKKNNCYVTFPQL